MAKLKKLFPILLLSAYSVALFPSADVFADRETRTIANEEETMNIVITINGNSYAKMKNIPTTGFLEVYTILGERKKQLKLSDCKDGASLELTNGLYILKAGKVTQKIIVR